MKIPTNIIMCVAGDETGNFGKCENAICQVKQERFDTRRDRSGKTFEPQVWSNFADYRNHGEDAMKISTKKPKQRREIRKSKKKSRKKSFMRLSSRNWKESEWALLECGGMRTRGTIVTAEVMALETAMDPVMRVIEEELTGNATWLWLTVA